jgi:hypothetical protein
MLIRVIYDDGSSGMVDDSRLDDLINDAGITLFLRSSGWVHITHDPVRRSAADRRSRGRLINIYV